MKYLIVVDMQNDFVTGCLGTEEAKAIVPNVVKKVKNFDGEVLFTQDTHKENYLSTEEGKNLPVVHCVEGTEGWEIIDELKEFTHSHFIIEGMLVKNVIKKDTFGSDTLGDWLNYKNMEEPIDSVELIGVCTGICVIANAIIAKSFLPNVPIYVDESCCACVTPESHKTAIEAMKLLQIHII